MMQRWCWLHCVAKYIATVHQLAYGMAVDMIDEYLKLWKSTVLECQEFYCLGIIEYFRVKLVCHPIVAL
jgi:hypothetical protein